MTQTGILTNFGAPNGPQNWASEAHILHTSKSSYNDCVKQYWLEASGNFFEKMTKEQIWGPKNWALGDHMVQFSESSSKWAYKARLLSTK